MDIPEIFKTTIGSLVRWILQGLGVWLVAKGVLSEEQADTLLVTVGGIAISGVVLGWSFLQKYIAQKRKAETAAIALALPSAATPKQLDVALVDNQLPPVNLEPNLLEATRPRRVTPE